MTAPLPTRPHADIEVGGADGVTVFQNAAGVPLSAVGSRMLLQTLLTPRPPLRVCLRHRPEITGTVVNGSADPLRVLVRWDDTEQETHCLVANLAAADEDIQGGRR